MCGRGHAATTGVGETTTTLATESGITVFRVAFARWVAPGRDASLTDLIADVRAVTSAPERLHDRLLDRDR